jgi:hypothetical protein
LRGGTPDPKYRTDNQGHLILKIHLHRAMIHSAETFLYLF